MVLVAKFVIVVLAFGFVSIPSASEPNKMNICGVDAHITETKYAEEQSNIPQWLTARLDIVLGFILGLVGANIVDCLRTKRKAKQFRHSACSELKQALAELVMYTMHPDATIDKEKVQLWLDSKRNFNLNEVIFPTEDNEEFKKLEKLELNPEQIDDFVSLHNSQREQKRIQGKMKPPRKLNYVFISQNIETASILNVRDTSRLLNILRRIDALNSCVDRIDFAFKKTFDSSISSTCYDNIKLNYYSGCQCLSDFAKITAKEVADLIRKWQ